MNNLLDWRSIAVLRRHFLVFTRTWKTAFIPPLFEPLVTLLAMGLGVGWYVMNMHYADTDYTYLEYIVPGIIVNSVFFTSFFEGLYAAYVRMFYQKSFDGMLTTRLEITNIIWGEILWGATRALITLIVLSLVLIVLKFTGLIRLNLYFLPVVWLICFISSFCFTPVALMISSNVPTIDHLSYGVFLIAIPISFISNTFFPFDSYHPVLYWFSQINPVYHLSELIREMLLAGKFSILTVIHLLVIIISIPLPVYFAHKMMKKRVLGE